MLLWKTLLWKTMAFTASFNLSNHVMRQELRYSTRVQQPNRFGQPGRQWRAGRGAPRSGRRATLTPACYQ